MKKIILLALLCLSAGFITAEEAGEQLDINGSLHIFSMGSGGRYINGTGEIIADLSYIYVPGQFTLPVIFGHSVDVNFALDSEAAGGTFRGVRLTQEFYLSFLTGAFLAMEPGNKINMATFIFSQIITPNLKYGVNIDDSGTTLHYGLFLHWGLIYPGMGFEYDFDTKEQTMHWDVLVKIPVTLNGKILFLEIF